MPPSFRHPLGTKGDPLSLDLDVISWRVKRAPEAGTQAGKDATLAGRHREPIRIEDAWPFGLVGMPCARRCRPEWKRCPRPFYRHHACIARCECALDSEAEGRAAKHASPR